MTEITTNQLEKILDLLGEGNERVADAREMLQKITKPKLKPADMSVFIDQPVLCEFWGAQAVPHRYGFLQRQKKSFFIDQRDVPWHHCQPKFGYWQSARNFEKFEDFYLSATNAGFEIQLNPSGFRITCFRITGYRDGFGPRWECEQ